MKKLILCLALLTAPFLQTGLAQEAPASAKDSTIVVSILGAVNRPGLAYLGSEGSLVGAIASCGGWVKTANMKKVFILRGKAGEKPERTEYDVTLILEGQRPNPKLLNGDIIYVIDRLF